MTEKKIPIGTVVSLFGLNGILKVKSDGDILKSLTIPVKLPLQLNNKLEHVTIINMRVANNLIYLGLEGVECIESAKKFIGGIFYFDHPEKLKKDSGEYFIFELIGLTPLSNGNRISEFKLDTVIENPAHPILSFRNKEREVLIPFHSKYVGEIMEDKGEIEIFFWEDFSTAF